MKKRRKRAANVNRPDRFECRGRIWIEGRNGTFLGYGRVVLLERIKKYGSITAAAHSMDMSYRHAWDLVESMNRQFLKPLVVGSVGGKGGGGSKLTGAGEKAVDSFRELYSRLHDFLEKETQRLAL